MGQPEETPGFIEEALRHRQVVGPTADASPEDADHADHGGIEADADLVPEREPEADADPEPPAEATPPFSSWAIPERALIDEALRKSGVIWLQTKAAPAGQGYWHVWLDDTIYLLTGGSEQPDGGIEPGDLVTVIVRSKETTARLVSFQATVSDLAPTDDDWDAASAALAAARLNLHDAPGAPDRWAQDPRQRLIRVTPSDPDGERPGAYSDESHRAAPRPSTATTAGPKPRVLHRRHGSGRPLS